MFKFTYKDIDFAHKLDKASDPADDYSSHMHYFNELLFFVSGDVSYHVETFHRTLQPGDIVFVPSGKYHFGEVNTDAIYERFVLKFPDSVLPKFLCEKMHSINFFFEERKELLPQFNQLEAYFNNFSDEELYTLYSCELTKIMIFLCRNRKDEHMQYTDFMSSVLKYIDDNIQDSITLTGLTEQFHFSRSYICNEFKKHMKMPLMQYIRTKKIIAAHNMIVAGKRKHEVAELFNFSDYSTFYRAYVKVMGFPPCNATKPKF